MKKILLVGDSISMVRPNEGVFFQDLFITKLNIIFPGNIVVNAALRSNDTQSILKDHFLNEYVHPLSPDIIILQMGIVDASPRIFTKNEKMILSILSKSRLMKPLAKRVIKFRSERRYEFTQKRAVSSVTLSDFKNNLDKFLSICKNDNPNVHFIVINICKPGKFMIERNFGIISQILAYNAVLSDFRDDNNFELIDIYNYTAENPDTLLPDGYHITPKIHLYLFHELQLKLGRLLNY